MMFYAIVSFGGSVPGQSVFDSAEEAKEHCLAVERDSLGNQEEYACDPQVTARARVYEYATRELAEKANISDNVGRTVWVRS